MKRSYIFAVLITFSLTIQSLIGQDYTSQKLFAQEQLAIREVRRNAISANIGWNGLTGLGITYHNYVGKQMGVDLGVGIATTGIKVGARFRYLFMEKNFSPYVAAGLMYGLGSGGVEMKYEQNGNTFYYTIEGSPFGQIVLGIEHLSNKGFLFMFNLGYAFLLNDGNYKITQGVATNDDLLIMNATFGSGIIMEFTLGYAFGGK